MEPMRATRSNVDHLILRHQGRREQERPFGDAQIGIEVEAWRLTEELLCNGSYLGTQRSTIGPKS
jgi:hypothetical protein